MGTRPQEERGMVLISIVPRPSSPTFFFFLLCRTQERKETVATFSFFPASYRANSGRGRPGNEASYDAWYMNACLVK